MGWSSRDEESRADHFIDERKHDWRPGDPMPLDQRLAVARLIGYCEGLVKSGLLGTDTELNLRKNIAEVCVAFHMPSSREQADAH